MSNREEMIKLLQSISDEEFDKIKVIDATRYHAIVVDGEENQFTVAGQEQIDALNKLYSEAGKEIIFRQMEYKETAFNSI